MNKKVIVTGGTGFIGAYLVKKFLKEGYHVGVVDTMIRGDINRLNDIKDEIELFDIDVRNEEKLYNVFKNIDLVVHLAAINGTENFYKYPELVLDVGVRGAIAVMNAARKQNIPDVIMASSAEVYQTPEILPTPETIALMLPDSLNPRYSYGGSKIITELIAFNYGREHFKKVQIFRPHNVYGPNMGWKHVIPQFIEKASKLTSINCKKNEFIIQGNGSEIRSFCYIDDVVEGIYTMYIKGGNREIYNIGNDEKISIKELANIIGDILGIKLNIKNSTIAIGSTQIRQPDISKIKKLNFNPKINIYSGLQKTISWYIYNKNNEKNMLL